MTKFKVLLCVVLAFTFSSSAFAGKDSGFYLGGSVGSASTEFDTGTEFSLDDDANGYKVFAGYNFGWVPMFDLAVEGSYIDFGEVSSGSGATKITASSNGWDLFGLAGMNFGPLGVFAKVGYFSWETDISGYLEGSDDGSDPAYGLGVKFQFSSFAVRGEYEMFDAGDGDLNMISVGAAYTF